MCIILDITKSYHSTQIQSSEDLRDTEVINMFIEMCTIITRSLLEGQIL